MVPLTEYLTHPSVTIRRRVMTLKHRHQLDYHTLLLVTSIPSVELGRLGGSWNWKGNKCFPGDKLSEVFPSENITSDPSPLSRNTSKKRIFFTWHFPINPFNDRASHYSGSCIFGYNSAPAAAREVFKPSTYAESLLGSIKKNIFWFGWGVRLGEARKVGVFSVFWPTLTRPGRQSHGPKFWLKLVLETRQLSASIEPLLDLLACLEPKLWPKNPILPPNQKIAENAWVSHWRLL